jgi:hypothetical protein
MRPDKKDLQNTMTEIIKNRFHKKGVSILKFSFEELSEGNFIFINMFKLEEAIYTCDFSKMLYDDFINEFVKQFSENTLNANFHLRFDGFKTEISSTLGMILENFDTFFIPGFIDLYIYSKEEHFLIKIDHEEIALIYK